MSPCPQIDHEVSSGNGTSVSCIPLTFPPFSHNVLAAYFSPSRLDELDTIDSIRGVGDVAVPEGWFRSARIGRNRRDSRSQIPPIPSPESQRSPSNSPTFHPMLAAPSGGQSFGSPIPYKPDNSQHQLVPLEVLVRTSGPRRDPADEQLLRRFCS